MSDSTKTETKKSVWDKTKEWFVEHPRLTFFMLFGAWTLGLCLWMWLDPAVILSPAWWAAIPISLGIISIGMLMMQAFWKLTGRTNLKVQTA